MRSWPNIIGKPAACQELPEERSRKVADRNAQPGENAQGNGEHREKQSAGDSQNGKDNCCCQRRLAPPVAVGDQVDEKNKANSSAKAVQQVQSVFG